MTIHPTAIVDSKAELADDVTVGPYCIIDGNVRVGAGCRLYHGVYLTGWTQIGPGCELHPGVIVGHTPQDTKYSGERTYCRVGEGTILREYVTIHRGTIPESETVVGDQCFLLAGVHVGHNCRVGDRVTIVNNGLLGGHVSVGDGVMIGGMGGIHQFVRVGELAMLAACSRVVQDVVPFSIVDTDGKIAGLNKIGLRRAEMPREHISELKHAFGILFSKRGAFREATERVALEMKSPPGKRLVEFLQTESRRGFAGGSRTSDEA